MYIYKHPNFFIPKEFQDWLIAAYNWKHNWNKVIDISWKWNHWTTNGGLVIGRRNNTHYMKFDGSDDKITINTSFGISWEYTLFTFIKANSLKSSWDNFIVSIWEYMNTDETLHFWFRNTKIYLWYWNDDFNTNTTIDINKTYCLIAKGDVTKQREVLINWKSIWTNTAVWNINTTWALTYIWKRLDNESSWENTKFDWYIYLLLIYNKALSQKQIQKMYDFFRQWYYD